MKTSSSVSKRRDTRLLRAARMTAATLLAAALLAALTALLSGARAQEAAPAPAMAPAAAAPAATTPAARRALQVGDATHDLMAKQRSGELASSTARPIAGDVAQRSYERYLRSFDHPIPESFVNTVKSDSKSSAK
jgi:hypothetical protein